ncbi:hypothetical protein LUX34_23065 [Streptomyces werraensis]|nr:hypothetical protein [Streptomyces werraensis]
MTTNANEPRESLAPGVREDQAADGSRSASTLPQSQPPRVAGRLDTYRSRSAKWHRQVKVDRCPRCGHPHLHRAPLPVVEAVLKTAPCGLEYLVDLTSEAVAA